MRPLRDPVRLAKPTPTPLDMGIDICSWSYAIDIDIGSKSIDYKRYWLHPWTLDSAYTNTRLSLYLITMTAYRSAYKPIVSRSQHGWSSKTP